MEEKEFMEEVISDTKDILPKKPKKNIFKTKKCKVISYNKATKNLDIDFDGYGIRIHNIQDFEGDFVEIKYKGNIGKENFVYKL